MMAYRLRKEPIVPNTQPEIISHRSSARTSTAVAALIGLTLGYVVATVANPIGTLPVASAHAEQTLRAGPGAETLDNSRECDIEAGVTTACIFV